MGQRQHYVAQFYLKGFELEGKITVLDKLNNNKIFQTSVNNLCVESDFFSLDCTYGAPVGKNDIESELSQIETNIAKILTAIRTENYLESITTEEFVFLLEWIAWILLLNPAYKAVMSQFIRLTQGVEPNNTDIIIQLAGEHKKLFKHFLERSWQYCVITPDEGSLISSDRPVNLFGDSADGVVGLDTGVLYFPLSPQLLLLSKKTGECGFSHKPNNKYSINQLQISNGLASIKAHRFLITNNVKKFTAKIKKLATESAFLNIGLPQVDNWTENEKSRFIKIINR